MSEIDQATDDRRCRAVWRRVGPLCFFLVLGLLWSIFAGKDINFDFRNYHLYSGLELLQGRLHQDYFPSMGAYLNPLAELPLYGMVVSDWNDQLIAVILVLLHLPNLYVIWKITEHVTAQVPGTRRFSCWAATLLAFVAPIQLTTLSNTFADPTAGLFTLLGLYVLLRYTETPAPRWYAVAGVLFGLGAGLKLTNLLFIPGALVVLVWILWRRQKGALGLAAFLLGAGSAFLLVDGWWAWKLYREFGNPIFPLYNSIFRSPDFISENFSDQRMLHYGRWTWAMLPIIMLRSGNMLYSENSIPDIRLLCTVVAVVLGGGMLALRAYRSTLYAGHVRTPDAVATRAPSALWLLALYFGISYMLWGTLSGIARYGYVLWLLLGPIFVGMLAMYAPASVCRVTVSVVLAMQVIVQLVNGNPSWTPHKWSGRWVNIEVPSSLKEVPASYLLYGVQSNSFIIPYLHRDSRFSNLLGQYAQPASYEMTWKLRQFLEHPIGPLRIIVEKNPSRMDYDLDAGDVAGMDMAISGYGYRLKSQKCLSISLREEPVPKGLDGSGWLSWEQRHADPRAIAARFYVCDLEAISSSEYRMVQEKYHQMDSIFDAVEDICGSVLAPHRIQTVRTTTGGFRSYFNTLMILRIEGDHIFIRPSNSGMTFPVGKVSAFRRDGSLGTCPDIATLKRSPRMRLIPKDRSESSVPTKITKP